MPESIQNILECLKENIFDLNNCFENGIFGDFTSVFKTGILTEKILKQSSIIMKNLPNLPTASLERSNDLFNYNPKFVLNEDTCGTFTKKGKEVVGFINSFRAIGTSSLIAVKNLSDAVRSRFSIIYTTSYTQEERNLIIKIFYEDVPDKFFDFIKKYEENFHKELAFL